MILDPGGLFLAVPVLALLLDAAFGEPKWLWSHAPHPVVVIGRAVGALDRGLNREDRPDGLRLLLGGLTVALIVGGAAAVGVGLTAAFRSLGVLPGVVLEGLAASILIAGRSLHEHVRAVHDGLRDGGLDSGRAAVAMIVGRDPDSLDESGVCRAAIESNAENYSDGVVAPLFWLLLLGLPGLMAYKAVNTLDSMIGHRSARHRLFGRVAARLDDSANWFPARLTALLFAMAAIRGFDASSAFRSAFTDARRHRSVNAGWPEAAMGGALGLALAGPRHYGDAVIDDPWMNAGGRREANAEDVMRSLVLTRRSTALLLMALALGILATTAN